MDPKISHENVKRGVKHLVETKDMGINVRINRSKGVEAHVESDFASTWSKVSPEDIAELQSRT